MLAAGRDKEYAAMNVLGGVLCVAGLAAAGFGFAGMPIEPFHSIPLEPLHWLGVAVLGGVILYFNRRPGD